MTFALILDEALKLPQNERESLCSHLLESLRISGSDDSPLLTEMRNRIQFAEDHPGELEDWEDVKAELQSARGNKW